MLEKLITKGIFGTLLLASCLPDTLTDAQLQAKINQYKDTHEISYAKEEVVDTFSPQQVDMVNTRDTMLEMPIIGFPDAVDKDISSLDVLIKDTPVLDITNDVTNISNDLIAEEITLQETTDSTPEIKATIPYICDEHTIALWHFDGLNYLIDQCKGLKLNDTGSLEISSINGFGQARHLNGNTYLELPFNSAFQPTSVTVEALIKPDTTGVSYTDTFGNIVTSAMSGVDGSFWGYLLFVKNNIVGVSIGLDKGEWHSISVPYEFPTNTFTPIAFSFDKGSLKLYINKELKAIQTLKGNIGYQTQALRMGLNVHNGFIGSIDEVRISDIAREF